MKSSRDPKYVERYEDGSFENEALENEDRSTKHPKLENEAPKKLDTGLSFINTRPM